MSTLVVKLKRRAKSFNKKFNRKERTMIIIGSILTLVAFILGIIALGVVFTKVFNFYIEATAPKVLEALDRLLQVFLPDWTL